MSVTLRDVDGVLSASTVHDVLDLDRPEEAEPVGARGGLGLVAVSRG